MGSLLNRIKAAANAFRSPAPSPGTVFPSGGGYGWLFGPRTNVDFKAEIGNPLDNSIVTSCFGWLSDSWKEARPVVERSTSGGKVENEFDHQIIQLLENPNPFYSGELLLDGMLQDYVFDGTAFAEILRDKYGLPIALFWMPTEAMTPYYVGDGNEWIRYWIYTVGGKRRDVAPENVWVWQQGIDRNFGGRKGYSRFKSAIADAFTDNEARNTVNSILRNRAQMGLMISPSERYMAEIVKAGANPLELGYNKDTADEIRSKINTRHTKDGRGSTEVLSVPMSVTEFGSVLDKIDSAAIRGLSEERICSIFKIHPVVLGLGAGLRASSDKHNMEFAHRMSWLNGVAPVQNSFSKSLNSCLMPFMDTDSKNARFDFDRSNVPALQEDADAKSTRLLSQWEKDAIKHGELRTALGREVDPSRAEEYFSAMAPVSEEPPALPDDAKQLKERIESMWRERANGNAH